MAYPVSATVFAGLGTYTQTITVAGQYTVTAQASIPFVQGTSANSASTVGQSGLQIVINQNGSPLVTVGGSTSNPTPTQPTLSTAAIANFAVNDVLTVVMSSANAVDAAPNAVKTIINVFQGPI